MIIYSKNFKINSVPEPTRYLFSVPRCRYLTSSEPVPISTETEPVPISTGLIPITDAQQELNEPIVIKIQLKKDQN